MPWNLYEDLKHFKDVTSKTSSEGKKNAVIMGRKTWESIPENFRPLKDRINIVISRNESLNLTDNVIKAKSLKCAFEHIKKCENIDNIEDVYVIGGQQIFEEAIFLDDCKKLYITHIEKSFDCDTFFPQYKDLFEKNSSEAPIQEGDITYYFSVYKKKL